ncbi:MAG TPA: choice-of-anchor J domain-containing protein, partial [Flavobacteriales bacterium]|nr:choice-of-anchor J domain-containing protein [Flavobacteriales bacterium]
MMNDELDGSFRAIAPAQGLPFNEGFETAAFPPANWSYTHFNKNLYMQRVTNASGMGQSTACMKMDNFSGSMDITGQLDYLITPPVDLSSAASGTELGFNVAYRQYNSGSTDALHVKVSTDCGGTWSEVYNKQGATLSTGTPTTSAFTPTAAQWRWEQVDISSVIGQPEVLFMFETESNWGNNVYIDDVQISAEVGIHEQSAISFSLFPNPANDEVRLDLGNAQGPVEVSIMDAAGRTVVTLHPTAPSSNSTVQIPLTGLANGTYTVVVRTSNAVGTKPLVVINAH